MEGLRKTTIGRNIAEGNAMWHTSTGDRTPTGAEATLIRAALDQCFLMVQGSMLDPSRESRFGAEEFDKLLGTQKLAMLARVGECLLVDTAEPVKLSAINEAAVATLYHCVLKQIAEEIDCAHRLPTNWRFLWRQLTAEASRERLGSDDVPARSDADIDSWETEVEGLRQAVLWDDDYDDADLYVDRDPEQARFLRGEMCIEDGYFAEIAPDPTEQEAESIRRKLNELIRGSPLDWMR